MSNWKTIVGRWGSGAGEVDDVRIDASTNSLQTVDYAHHEIHSGSHYFIKNYHELANGEVLDFLAVTPDTTAWAHMITHFSTEAEAMIQIYEGTTASADGTPVTAVNRNRNSIKTAGVVINAAPTITTVGTLLSAYISGSGRSIGGEARAESEMVLKQNTKYLIRITNNVTTPNHLDYLADWYEHTDKH